MSSIPMDLITSILCRLPVKSLLRFRCVSKPWCAVIDGSDFVKMHLNLSAETRSNLGLILGGLGIYTLDFDSLDDAVEFNRPFKNIDVVTSCNGLVLLTGESVALFNPSTRRYRKLPEVLFEQSPGPDVASVYETFGFGYDSVKDDYKVLKVAEYRDNDLQCIKSEAKVYSLKSNSWRTVVLEYKHYLPFKRVWGVHINGALHTVATFDGYHRVIVAFDVRVENCHSIPLPDFRNKNFDLTLEAVGGCLCMLTSNRGCRTDIWIMNDYGVKESWTKLLSISPKLFEDHFAVKPLALAKECDEVLLSIDEKGLFWFNLRRKTIRIVPASGLPFYFYAEVYVESLVPLDGCDGIIGTMKQYGRNSGVEMKNKKRRDDFLSEGFKLVL